MQSIIKKTIGNFESVMTRTRNPEELTATGILEIQQLVRLTDDFESSLK